MADKHTVIRKYQLCFGSIFFGAAMTALAAATDIGDASGIG